MAELDVTTCKLALLTGGWSDEREIAIDSARACQRALGQAGFQNIDFIDVAEPGVASKLEQGGYDVAFIAMHGRYGEDGCVQGMLEVMGIPYTFSNVTASAVATNKHLAKLAYFADDIPVADGYEIDSPDDVTEDDIDEMIEVLGLPVFVKPTCNGSSYGITKVKERAEFMPAIELACGTDGTCIVEECIDGIEVTVPVLGNKDPQALPVIEIEPGKGAEFYNLKVKYEPSDLHHVIPARLPEDVYKEVQELAVAAHLALGCAGASRSDFIITEDGTPVILETNTIPGMTETSLLPDSARHAGIEFPDLCRKFVELALE